MYPVLSATGSRIGYVQRQYPAISRKWRGPKAINRIEDTSVPFVHFPRDMGLADSLTLVEDYPSSEAVAQHRPCAALMGTNITNDMMIYFSSLGIRNLTICLDADMHKKSIEYRRKLSLFFEVDVMLIDKDPKDMDEEELCMFS